MIISIAFAAFVVHTGLGRRLKAMRDDHLAAAAMGAEVPILRMVAFAFGGLYGGVAGVLYAGMIRYVAPGVIQPREHVLPSGHGGHRRSPQPSWRRSWLDSLIFIREALADFSIYAQLGYGALVVIIVVFLPARLCGIPVQMRKSWQRRRGHTLTSKSVGIRMFPFSSRCRGVPPRKYLSRFKSRM